MCDTIVLCYDRFNQHWPFPNSFAFQGIYTLIILDLSFMAMQHLLQRSRPIWGHCVFFHCCYSRCSKCNNSVVLSIFCASWQPRWECPMQSHIIHASVHSVESMRCAAATAHTWGHLFSMSHWSHLKASSEWHIPCMVRPVHPDPLCL